MKLKIRIKNESGMWCRTLKKKHILNFLVILSSTAFSILIAEICLRVFFKDRLEIDIDVPEMRLPYRHDKVLGWFPIENSNVFFTANCLTEVKHNSRGFRDIEHVVSEKPGIMFVGDSFTWGYDIDASDRFTDILREKLSGFSIYNLGVTGYGTDQEYLLLRRHYDYYKPKIVVLVFCVSNDFGDNIRNKNFHMCGYKPYFKVDSYNNDLELKGVPVPQSENVFFTAYRFRSNSYVIRLISKIYFKYSNPKAIVNLHNPTHLLIAAMNKFVRDKGSIFIVGFTKEFDDQNLKRTLNLYNIPYITFDGADRWPSAGQHWTTEGHRFVAEKIYEFMVNGDYLKKDDE